VATETRLALISSAYQHAESLTVTFTASSRPSLRLVLSSLNLLLFCFACLVCATKVQRLSVVHIALEVARLHAAAQAGKLASEDVTGGTFTVSNIGKCGQPPSSNAYCGIQHSARHAQVNHEHHECMIVKGGHLFGIRSTV
jgi:hypothetical protein